MPTFTISQLAKQAAVNPTTVRYYERRGLLPVPERSTAGYRLYLDDSVRRLHFIKQAQDMGFSLTEVQQLLDFVEKKRPSAAVCALATEKIKTVDEKIRQLKALKKALQRLTDSCNRKGTTEDCVIIKRLYA